MPEPYWPKKKNSYSLRDAEKNSRYARIFCRYCKRERLFLVRELRVVFGDIEVDDVVYSGSRWRCEGCDGTGVLDLNLVDDRSVKGAVVRRLVKIEHIRRPVWRDEQN